MGQYQSRTSYFIICMLTNGHQVSWPNLLAQDKAQNGISFQTTPIKREDCNGILEKKRKYFIPCTHGESS